MVTIFWAMLIEVGKVYAYPPSSAWLFYYNWIDNPCGLLDFKKHISGEELAHINLYDLILLGVKFLLVCLTGLNCRLKLRRCIMSWGEMLVRSREVLGKHIKIIGH